MGAAERGFVCVGWWGGVDVRAPHLLVCDSSTAQEGQEAKRLSDITALLFSPSLLCLQYALNPTRVCTCCSCTLIKTHTHTGLD